MSTVGDIRAKFEAAMQLNENATTIEGILLAPLEKKLGKGRVNSKSGNKDMRFDLGGEEKTTIKSIQGALNSVEIQNANITTVAPGDYANGGNSGKFYTYIITLSADISLGKLNLKSGDSFKIVDNNPPKGSIKSKELTPTSLRIPEDYDLTANTLRSSVHSAIDTKYGKSNVFLKTFLTELYEVVFEHTPKTHFDSPLTIASFTENISFSENIKYGESVKESIVALGAADLNTIGKDFGEILGAALMLNMVKTQKGITFPSGNNPLVDFFIDGYGISSKYKSGAAPTLSNIIKNLDSNNFIETSEVQLYNLFKIVENNNVIDGYIKGADFMNLPSAIKLKELTGIKDLNAEVLEKFAQNGIAGLGEEEFFYKYVKPLVESAGRGSSTFNSVSWDKLKSNKKYVGLLSYPLSLQLIDKLNGRLGDGELYINTLRIIVSKLEVKQLYMDINLKNDTIEFYLKGFGDEGAKLTFEAPNVSAPNPGNGKLGFKMK